VNDSAFRRLTAPLRRRIKVLFTRALGSLVDPTTLMQTLQVEALAGEVLDGVEHFEPYGFTSNPLPGFEALLAALGGDRAHTVCIVAADRRNRITDLASGESALYDDQGQKVHLQRAGILVVTTLNATVQADGTVLVKAGSKATVEGGGTVEIIGATAAPVKGIVQGDCICAYTGAPHPHISATVKGSV
jgi:phage baseplate assembly protein V